MPECALPDHLKGKLHNDWPWPMNKLKRSINAFGPRCPVGSSGYRGWPPLLVKGYGVSRWESTGAQSIIHIPEFDNKRIDRNIYPHEWDAIEMNPAHTNYKKTVKVKLNTEDYSPSALQKFSKRGWMKLDPWYVAQWFVIRRMKPPREDWVAFHRQGYRPDHMDKYYNWGPFAGFHFE